MYGYMLQDWTTLDVDPAVGAITQTEGDWMSFQAFQDIVFWTDVRAVNVGGGVNVQLAFETAPSKDDTLFVAMATVTLAVSGAPTVTPVLIAANPSVPLSRWVRWRLLAGGGPASNWGATFRVMCSANQVGGR
jgi:hypothetical protein